MLPGGLKACWAEFEFRQFPVLAYPFEGVEISNGFIISSHPNLIFAPVVSR